MKGSINLNRYHGSRYGNKSEKNHLRMLHSKVVMIVLVSALFKLNVTIVMVVKCDSFRGATIAMKSLFWIHDFIYDLLL